LLSKVRVCKRIRHFLNYFLVSVGLPAWHTRFDLSTVSHNSGGGNTCLFCKIGTHSGTPGIVLDKGQTNVRSEIHHLGVANEPGTLAIPITVGGMDFFNRLRGSVSPVSSDRVSSLSA